MKIQPKILKKTPFLIALMVLASLPIQALVINLAANEDINRANAFEALTISPNQGPTTGGTDVTISGLGFDDTVDIVQVDTGDYHSLALDSNGKVYAWGGDGSGMLGNGATTGTQVSPVAVDTSGVLNGKTITAVAAGSFHSLALDSSGKVYSWGSSPSGALGNGTTSSQVHPVTVDTSGVLSGKTITSIAAGHVYSLALDSSGKVYSWGDNYSGQLGNGSTADNQLSPIAVDASGALNGKTITAISASMFDSLLGVNYYSLALDSSGKVYSWGNDDIGQLGNGATTGNQLSPVPVDTNPATSALAYIHGPISVTFDPTGTVAECANVVLVDENTITCTTSAHIAGTVDMLVSDTVRTSLLQQAFTYKDITPEVPDTGAK